MLIPDTLENYKKAYQIEWADDLPYGCPPSNILIPDNHDLYRLSLVHNEVTEDDFQSYQKLYPEREFKGNEYVPSTGLSVFDVIPYHLKKFPKWKDKNGSFFRINLSPEDGVLIKSSKANHYTWWRTKAFNISSVELLTDEKA